MQNNDELDITANAVRSVAQALTAEMHEGVARICRPVLLELTRLFKGTGFRIVRAPDTPTSIVCDPALFCDDFTSENDLVKWIQHNGHESRNRNAVVDAVMTIVSTVDRLEGSGLTPSRLEITIEDDYRGEDVERTAVDLAKVTTSGPDEGLAWVSMEDLGGEVLRVSDSSLAYPAAMRFWTEGRSVLLTQGQVASLIPTLLHFVRSGSVAPVERT